MKKKAFLFCIVLFLFCVEDVLSEEKTLLWKVQNNNNVVYLLGSIHLAKSDIYPLDENIEKAFEEADVIGFELIPSKIDPNEILKKGLYEDSTLLKDVLSEETYNILKEEFKSLKIPEFVYKKYKPWFAIMTLTSLYYNKYGFISDYGIENYFLKKSEGKELIEMETLDEQIEVFENSDNYFLNDEFVKMSIFEMKNSISTMDSLILAWKRGDIVYLDSVINAYRYQSKEDEIFYTKILDDRNIKMANKIEQILEKGDQKKYFIIIGAGHLIGKNSIIDILQRKNKYDIVRF